MPGKSSSSKKGGSGGGSTEPLYLVGTAASERLRGSDADDTFEGLGGDDLLIGKEGTDTAIYSGSVWDYTWYANRRDWTVNDRNTGDGDDGTDTLQGIEILQFDDATIVLGEDSPTVVESETVYTTVGETAEFTLTVSDYDHFVDVDYVSRDIDVGRIWYQADSDYGGMGSTTTLNITFDPAGYFNSMDLTYLAEGETITVNYRFEITTYQSFVIGDTSVYHDIPIVVAGVNDAPTLAAAGPLEVTEGGAPVSLDLAPFGDDVDSDDDGTTLSYEIISAPAGFDVSIDGTVLTYDPASIDPDLSSDESLTGSVVIRATDQHGATSNDITIDLKATGIDGPRQIYVTPQGVDYDALGVDLDASPNLGQLVTFYNPDPVIVDLVTFSDADETRLITAERVAWFNSDASFVDENGVELLDDLSFNTGGGDDVLVFDIAGAAFAGFEVNDVSMGTGEDILAITVEASGYPYQSDAIINGASIDTGANSDQVWLEVSSDTNGWIATDLNTGSGHDIVEIHLNDTDTSTPGGAAFYNGSVNLGTGDDSFNLVIDAGERAIQAEIDIGLWAGDGDDFVFLSNADTALVLNPESPTGGLWDNLYHAGLSGGVYMGDGNDVLELDLNDAYEAGDGAHAILDGGEGHDVLVLHHLVAGEATVSSTETGWQIDDDNQVLEITGFEEIRLGDGTDLFGV